MNAREAKANIGSRSRLIAYSPLLWLLAIPVLNIFYGKLNHWRGGNISSLMTGLDNLIPFLPIFIIPYLIWYPFIFMMFIVFCVKDKVVYYRSLITLCVGLLACYLVFALFQTKISRPVVAPDSLLNQLVAFVYAMDGPFNCFPSIHVLSSYVVLQASYLCRFKQKAQSAILITAWSIIISTLFVKQHALMDIVGALLLAESLTFIMKFIRFEK
jgi:membrane-associated phospholipid phosphatase